MSGQVVAFRVEGRPVPWSRAKVNGKRFFNNPKQAAHQQHVAILAKLAAGGVFFLGPVRLSCKFVFARPRSNKSKGPFMAQRPDGDNLLKQISDALNTVLWKDDAQVVKIESEKLWSDSGDEYSWVEVYEL